MRLPPCLPLASFLLAPKLAILLQVSYEAMCDAIRSSTILVTWQAVPVPLAELDMAIQYTKSNTIAWAETVSEVKARVSSAVEAAVEPMSDNFLQPVIAAFQNPFDLDRSLKRFDTLPAHLAAVLARLVHLALDHAKPEVDALVRAALLQLYKTTNAARKPAILVNLFSELDSGIKASIICHIMQQLDPKTLTLGSGFALTEDTKVHNKRMQLLETLSGMEAAIEEISRYRHASQSSKYNWWDAADADQLLASEPVSPATVKKPGPAPKASNSAALHSSMPSLTASPPSLTASPQTVIVSSMQAGTGSNSNAATSSPAPAAAVPATGCHPSP